MDRLKPPPIPVTAAHQELLQTVRSYLAGKIPPQECYAVLSAVVGSYLWPSAGERHGEILGILLALPLVEPSEVNVPYSRSRCDEVWACTGEDPPSHRALPAAIREIMDLVVRSEARRSQNVQAYNRLEEMEASTDVGCLRLMKYPFDGSQRSLWLKPVEWREYECWLAEACFYPREPARDS